MSSELTEVETVPATWLIKLLAKRDTWLSRRSGRRVEESLDRVRLFERDRLVTEVWVQEGKIERATAAALTIALDLDQHIGELA